MAWIILYIEMLSANYNKLQEAVGILCYEICKPVRCT